MLVKAISCVGCEYYNDLDLFVAELGQRAMRTRRKADMHQFETRLRSATVRHRFHA